MIQKLITAIQVLCLLAIISQGVLFVLTGTQPGQFVTLVFTALGAGAVYAILEGVDRWVV